MAKSRGRSEKRRAVGGPDTRRLRPAVEGLEARRLLAVAINEFGGSAAIRGPIGITLGPDGNLWFTETGVDLDPITGQIDLANSTGQGAIGRITPSGAIQRFTVGLSPFSIPTGITLGPDGALWFTEFGARSVSPFLPFGDSKIGRIDPGTGAITEFPTPTPNSGPTGITASPDGNLYFTEREANGIGRITPAGVITEFFAGITPGSDPTTIAVGPAPDFRLFFTQAETDQVGRFDPLNGTVTEFGQVPGVGRIAPDAAPTGIALGPDGALWFTEFGTSSIGRLDPITGNVAEFPVAVPGVPGNVRPSGIATGPDGNLYFTEQAIGQIGRISTAGVVSQASLGLDPSTGPASITPGPDGNLWFTEQVGNHVSRISINGVSARFPSVDALAADASPFSITTGLDGSLFFTQQGANAVGRIDTAGRITQLDNSGITPNAALGEITTRSDGTLFFTERSVGRIGSITPDGVANEFVIPTSQTGAIAQPFAITATPDGNVWFQVTNFIPLRQSVLLPPRIGRITPQGVLTLFGRDDFTANDLVGDITVGPDGALYFVVGFDAPSNQSSNRIGRVDAATGAISFLTNTPDVAFLDLTTGSDGALFVATRDTNEIIRVPLSGAPTRFPIPTGGLVGSVGPRGIIGGPDGAIYFVESFGNRVVRLALDGTFTALPIPSSDTAPFSLAIGGDRNLYFTESFSNRSNRPNSQIGQVILPQTSVVAAPVGPLNLRIGETFGGVLATFRDLSPAANAANFDAIIDYGDGTFLPGGVAPDGLGGFAVFAPSHAYASAGTFAIKVMIFNDAGMAPPVVVRAVVGNPVDRSTVVVNTNDFGLGSLRQAILFANQDGGGTITFAIPASFADPGTDLFTIRPEVPLPEVSARVAIDGRSQNFFGQAGPLTREAGLRIRVQVDGRGLSRPSAGLAFGPDARGSRLTALSIFGFAGPLVRLDSEAAVVEGSYLGVPVDPATRSSLAFAAANQLTDPDADGILVQAAFAIIGGAGFDDSGRNVISGNLGEGIELAGAAFGTQILRNYVGLDPSGGLALPNRRAGILVGGGATSGRIESNIVSGNGGPGIALRGTTGNLVIGNGVGTGPGRAGAFPNGGAGVVLDLGSANNTIGGLAGAEGNVLAGNRLQGLAIQGGSTGNIVLGNAIGTAFGRFANPNEFGGVLIFGASGNLIGPGNLISGNVGNGVELIDADANTIAGNAIGIGLADDPILGNGGSGICLDLGSDGNTIGGPTDVAINVISGNKQNGLAIQTGSARNVVMNNRVGTDYSGSRALPNLQSGILLSLASGNMIGPGNVLSANGAFGVELIGADSNAIAGNLIGTDLAGEAELGNVTTGVCIDAGSSRNTIGGPAMGGTNVISGNRIVGVAIQAASIGNVVSHNRIGTNSRGNRAIGNGIAGILVSESGGNDVGPGNLVSGNGRARDGAGIWVEGATATGNRVFGNRVGTDLAGTGRLANASIGILVNDAPGNRVGGETPEEANLISGNTQIGLVVAGLLAAGNAIQGNLIGTDASGARRLGDGPDGQPLGLYLLNAPGNTVGGPTPGLGNLISGNAQDGVELFGPEATGNVIQGNRVGLDASGAGPLGNGRDGIVLDGAPGNFLIANFVSANARNGIFLAASPRNTLGANAVGLGVGGQALGNGGIGILVGEGSAGTVASGNRNANNRGGAGLDPDPVVVAPARKARRPAGARAASAPFGSRPFADLAARGRAKAGR